MERGREEVVEAREGEKMWAEEANRKEGVIGALKKHITQIEGELEHHKHESNKQRMLSEESKIDLQRTS